MNRRDERLAVACFVAATGASIGLVVAFATGSGARAQGSLLAVALGGIGIGLAAWSHQLTGDAVEIEDRPALRSASQPREELVDTLERSSEPLGRRRVLLGAATAAGVSLAAALVLPVRSLGPSPGRALLRTSWRAGRRMVTPDGTALRAADLGIGNIVTVFPEGAVDAEDAATLLIRVEPELLELPSERLAGAPGGLVAYSKVCTHVGCPVGLYRETTHELVCPCHQSTFDVLRGARPTFGPATRPLPQLPIGIDDDGYLVALGDYPEPVGPGFWNRGA